MKYIVNFAAKTVRPVADDIDANALATDEEDVVNSTLTLLETSATTVQMTEFYNSLTSKPVKKFDTKAIAATRLFNEFAKLSPPTDKPETDKPETDKPATDKPETDKPATDQPATDQPTPPDSYIENYDQPAVEPTKPTAPTASATKRQRTGQKSGYGFAAVQRDWGEKLMFPAPHIKSNPRREGSVGWHDFDLVWQCRNKGGIDFATYIKLQGAPAGARWNMNHAFVTLLTHAEVLAQRAPTTAADGTPYTAPEEVPNAENDDAETDDDEETDDTEFDEETDEDEEDEKENEEEIARVDANVSA